MPILPNSTIRSIGLLSGASALVLLTGVLATPAAAAGSRASHGSMPKRPGFEFNNEASYLLDMRDAGVEENT
ncbi:MAG TPA: hypothetical protein VHV82_15365 [Sporichthyaceae bacterium]|jgi:hypothetical protein|nr:hypothetical protein [Sporichthyaceae bacterium]